MEDKVSEFIVQRAKPLSLELRAYRVGLRVDALIERARAARVSLDTYLDVLEEQLRRQGTLIERPMLRVRLGEVWGDPDTGETIIVRVSDGGRCESKKFIVSAEEGVRYDVSGQTGEPDSFELFRWA